MITNQDVFDALTSCIEDRWEWHAAHPDGEDRCVTDCALCRLFDGRTESEYDDNGEYVGEISCTDCEACPVFLMNGGKGCASGSAFDIWFRETNRETATVMLDSLKAAKKHFFGDWKE